MNAWVWCEWLQTRLAKISQVRNLKWGLWTTEMTFPVMCGPESTVVTDVSRVNELIFGMHDPLRWHSHSFKTESNRPTRCLGETRLSSTTIAFYTEKKNIVWSEAASFQVRRLPRDFLIQKLAFGDWFCDSSNSGRLSASAKGCA